MQLYSTVLKDYYVNIKIDFKLTYKLETFITILSNFFLIKHNTSKILYLI